MKTAFEDIVDDVLGTTLMYQLFVMAQMEVENYQIWEILKAYDATNTTNSGSVYTTQYSLPTRFLQPLSLHLGTDRFAYEQIPFEERERYQEATHRFYLDIAQDKYSICGTPASGEAHKWFYTKKSPDIASGVTWVFPTWSHLIIPIKAAKLYYPINTGEKARAWDDRWAVQERQIMNMLVSWNNRLRKMSTRSARAGQDPGSYPNVVY